jgi:hypothetical protein
MGDLKLECPLGLDESPSICSSKACAFCQIDEALADVAALRSENVLLTAKIESDAKAIAHKDAEIARLNSAFDDCAENANASQAEAERLEKVIAVLRAELQRIVDHYDTRTELYTNDADLAGGMADIARHAIEQTAGESK